MYKKRNSAKTKYGPQPLAARLLLIGQPLILIALMDIAVYIWRAGVRGDLGVHFLLTERGEYVLASAVILYGAALMLDYMEKACKKD